MVGDIINSFADLFAMENVTIILTVIPLIIFLVILMSKKSIKSFHFQILIFITLYFIGELIENDQISNSIFPSIPSYIGSQIHVIAALFFTIIMILRFVSSKQKTRMSPMR